MSVEFAEKTTHEKTTHKVRVSASAGVVYALFADAVNWPLYFSPSVHVERLEFDGERERLRTWCFLDGELKSWTSSAVIPTRDGSRSSPGACSAARARS